MTSTKRLPDFRAFTVIKKQGQKDFWLDIGAGFSHRDESGVTVLLDALPTDSKIVLRPLSKSAASQHQD